MANLKFRVRGKSENAPIYIKFSDGRTNHIELKTRFIINPKYFNNKTGKVRQIAEFLEKDNLQSDLNNLDSAIRKTFNTTTVYTKEWLQTEMNRFHGINPDNEKRFTFREMYDLFIEYKKYSELDRVEDSTLKSYNTTLTRFKAFEKWKEETYFIDEIGSDFKDEFVKWAKTVENYQPRTYKKSLIQIRAVCKYAKFKKKIEIDESIFEADGVETKKKKKKDEVFPHLTFEDIDKLMKFNGLDYLTNARDWLVISCWVGCRVSDLMELSTDKIILTIKGERALHYTQVKTGRDVEAPLHYHVEEILKRNDGFPRPISHQRYNDYIKDVCEAAKINEVITGSKMDNETNRKITGKFPKYELITSHIGRRSFATNHYGKFTNHQIMQVTGHSTERQFLEYIGKRDTEHITDFALYWNALKEDKQKEADQKQA